MLGDQHKFIDREEQRRLEGYRNIMCRACVISQGVCKVFAGGARWLLILPAAFQVSRCLCMF